MRFTIRLFGPEAAAAGTGAIDVEVDASPAPCTVLRDALISQHPELSAQLGRCRFAVNHEFVDDTTAVSDHDEIALIGQVSGG